MRWLNKQGVQGDSGFIVQCTTMETIEYREGEHVVTVAVEPGWVSETKSAVIIRADAFQRWDGDPPAKALPVEKQREMLANFTAGMEFQDVAVIVA
jgi:hypothetical protein